MNARIKRDLRQIEHIITNRVESHQSKVLSIRFAGAMVAGEIELCCFMQVITAQQDVASTSLHKDEIECYILGSLRSQGYQTLSGPTWFEVNGSNLIKEGDISDLTLHTWVELEPKRS